MRNKMTALVARCVALGDALGIDLRSSDFLAAHKAIAPNWRDAQIFFDDPTCYAAYSARRARARYHVACACYHAMVAAWRSPRGYSKDAAQARRDLRRAERVARTLDSFQTWRERERLRRLEAYFD